MPDSWVFADSPQAPASRGAPPPQYGAVFLRALRRRRWLVLAVFLGVAVPFGGLAILVPPQYESTGTVWVEESKIPIFQDFGQQGRLPVLLTILASQNLAS